jgi:hypothetical protein
MGFEHTVPFLNRIKDGLKNCRGISLLLIVLLMTAVAISAVGVLTLGVKLRSVAKERMVPERLDTIRQALQRYYLSHHDLPAPIVISSVNTLPVEALNLPQEHRFDSAGQFIHYDFIFVPPPVNVDILGLTVRNLKQYAAVLVAPGPDKQIASNNLGDPYADPTDPAEPNDDIVVAISFQTEAMKIASRSVSVLQAAAKAYDGQYDSANYNAQFDNANNDGDYNYPVNMIDPGPDGTIGTPDDVHIIDPGPDTIFCTFDDIPTPPLISVGPDLTADTADDTRDCRVIITLNGPDRIDEDGYVPAAGGSGTNCVQYGQLTNDPDRGTASLDGCATALNDIIDVFGLSQRYSVDPWGNAYLWGDAAAYDGLNISAADDADRNRRYWTFFSMGPDETADTDDDITPTTDHIVGYYATEAPPP